MTEQALPRRRRHHRRGPIKRFLLATGPFFFLTGAFLLSAGVVKVIEEVPDDQPQPTLAEERANAAPERVASARAASSAAARMPSLPGELLEGSDYDLRNSRNESGSDPRDFAGRGKHGLGSGDSYDLTADSEGIDPRRARSDFE
jgi:hypothetical protein